MPMGIIKYYLRKATSVDLCARYIAELWYL
jgi:hypothetical protein